MPLSGVRHYLSRKYLRTDSVAFFLFFIDWMTSLFVGMAAPLVELSWTSGVSLFAILLSFTQSILYMDHQTVGYFSGKHQ